MEASKTVDAAEIANAEAKQALAAQLEQTDRALEGARGEVASLRLVVKRSAAEEQSLHARLDAEHQRVTVSLRDFVYM